MKSKILIIHSDRAVRKALEAMCSVHHDVLSARDIKTGLKAVLKSKPALAVVGLDSRRKDALQLLRYMKDYGSTTPVIVVAGRGAGQMQLQAMKAGARGFVEFPVDQARLDREITSTLQASTEVTDSIPPLTDEEQGVNLSDLERTLNRRMKCHAGRNQVHLQSLIIGLRKTKPRISLKCPLRRDYKMPSTVYYEYIRDVCCNDPGACPAMQRFEARSSA